MGYKLKRITIRPNGTEIQVRPTTSPWWQPWANTIAYYPLTSDMNDYSGNNRNLTVESWTITYNSSTNMAELAGQIIYSQPLLPTSSDYTVWFWCYPSSWNNIGDKVSWWPQWYLCDFAWEYKWWLKIGSTWYRLWGTTEISWPCHLMVTRSGSTFTLYVNWQPDSTLTNSWAIQTANTFYISWFDNWVWWVILEDIAWDAQKVSDYYNMTKWDYWL